MILLVDGASKPFESDNQEKCPQCDGGDLNGPPKSPSVAIYGCLSLRLAGPVGNTGSRGIGYLNPVDFSHKANASITSRHNGGFVN